MNLNQDDSERDEVLHRYFLGELSDEERGEVESWISATQENQQIFDEAEVFFKDLRGLSYYQTQVATGADESWDQFRQDHRIEPLKPRSTGFMKYAASIVIVAASALGLYYYQQIPQDRFIAGLDEVQEIMLEEGSSISLNENATLAYQEPFQNNERRVRLEGEAYFDISSDKEKPFVVETGEAEVRVLGTQFFVDQSTESIQVQVEEGKVLVSYQDFHELLEQGEGVKIDVSQNQMSRMEEDPTGVDSFWKTRRLVFRLTPLEEVVRVVSEAYGRSVQLAGSSEGCQLTVTFDDESLENVLNVISGTLNLELTEEQGVFILSGDGCQ